MILVTGSFFSPFFEFIIFCFVVAIRDAEYDVEIRHGLSILLTLSGNLF